MAYTKQTWENLPSQTTPINADRLTHIEDGIFNAAATADTAASNASSAISGLADKVDKVEGKGLSTNDFTDALKTKLDNIETGAEVNVQSDWNQSDNSADDYIKNKPTLGTSAYKNSTSVVTDSTDLVESGAVYDALRDANLVNGKNLLPNNATSQTVNGVTFTVNSDGSVTANGTASADTSFTIGSIPNSQESVILTGMTQVGGDSTFLLSIWVPGGNAFGGRIAQLFNTDETVVNLSSYSQNMFYCGIGIRSGQTVSNLKFYPMIRKATESDPTYEPYYIPLKDVVPNKADNSVIGTVEDGATASQAYAVNDVFIRNGALCKVTSAISQGDTLSNQFTVTNVGAILTALLNA